jgi:hypothetical protein
MMGLWNPDEVQFHVAILIPGHPFPESTHPELACIHIDKGGHKHDPVDALKLQHHGRHWNDDGQTRQGQAVKILDDQRYSWHQNVRSSTTECSTLLTRKGLLDSGRLANTRTNFMPVPHNNFNDCVKGAPGPLYKNSKPTLERAQIQLHQGYRKVDGHIRCTTTTVDVVWHFHFLQKTFRRSFEKVTQNVANDKGPQFQGVPPECHPDRLACYENNYGMGSGLTVSETSRVYTKIAKQAQDEEGSLFEIIMNRGMDFIEKNFEDSQATGRTTRALDILLGNFTKTIEGKDGARPTAAATSIAPHAPAALRARVLQIFGNEIIFKNLKSTLKDKAKAVWLNAFMHNHTQLNLHCATAMTTGLGRSRHAPLQDTPLIKEIFHDHHKALAEEAERAN